MAERQVRPAAEEKEAISGKAEEQAKESTGMLSDAFSKITDYFRSSLSTQEEPATEAVGEGKESAAEGTHGLGESARETAESARETAAEQKDALGEKISEAKEAVSERARDIGESAREAAKEKKEAVGEKAAGARESTSGAVGDTFAKIADYFRGPAEPAKDEAPRERVAEASEELKSGAGQAAETADRQVEPAAEEKAAISRKAEEQAEETTGTLSDAFSKITDYFKGTSSTQEEPSAETVTGGGA